MTDIDNARRRAEALLDLGRPAEAEAHLRQALSSQPDDPDLLVTLSRALLMRHRFDEARQHAAAALAVDPQDANALSCLAAALSNLGRHDEALTAVRSARSLVPTAAVLHRQEARICLVGGRTADALIAARRAFDLDPNDAGNAVVCAEALLADDRFAEAAEATAEALRLDPENASAHRIAGLLNLRGGTGAESVARYRDALRLDPADRQARQGLALALKSRNPVYRRFLQFEFWVSERPSHQRWVIRLVPFGVARIAALGRGEVWSDVLLGLAVVFLFAAWATDPVMDLLLMADRADRHVLSPQARRSAVVFAGFAVGALACFLALWATGARSLVPLGFGLAFWALVVGSAGTWAQQRLFTATTVGAAACAAGGAVATALGATAAATALAAVLLVTGFVMLWLTALDVIGR